MFQGQMIAETAVVSRFVGTFGAVVGPFGTVREEVELQLRRRVTDPGTVLAGVATVCMCHPDMAVDPALRLKQSATVAACKGRGEHVRRQRDGVHYDDAVVFYCCCGWIIVESHALVLHGINPVKPEKSRMIQQKPKLFVWQLESRVSTERNEK